MERDAERTLDDVSMTLKFAKERQAPCCILIGAGCSLSAGIPLASGFVEEVRRKVRPAYNRAKEKTYPYVMGEVDVGPRYGLIAEHVEKACLNWAHLILGWLLRNGFVGRVLTTNFDNLTLRACSLYGVHPSVYDLAVSV